MLAALAFCFGLICGMMVMAVLALTRAQPGQDSVMHPRP